MANTRWDDDWPFLEDVGEELPVNMARLFTSSKGANADKLKEKSYALRVDENSVRRQLDVNDVLPPTRQKKPTPAEKPSEQVLTSPTREAASSSTFPLPPPTTPAPSIKKESTVFSVGDAVNRLRAAVSQELHSWWVSGEVSNFSRPRSGHVYFSLKDDNAQISCVFFAHAQMEHPVTFQNGDRIEVFGEADVYPQQGQLQIRLSDWRPAGMGALYEAYLKLKEKLRAEGLFASKMKPMPLFVRHLAVVTSEGAAALQDVRRTLARRMPWVKITLVPTMVQGTEAPAQIMKALKRADQLEVDAVLLVRGGGSFEDLFCFNDENLVRTIRAMKKLVVAGIGHETDETLASLAADICASTPTAAAEQVGYDLIYWQRKLDEKSERLTGAMERIVDEWDMYLDRVTERLEGVHQHYGRLEEYLSDKEHYIHRVIEGKLNQFQERIVSAQRWVASPTAMLSGKQSSLEKGALALERGMVRMFEQKSRLLEKESLQLSMPLPQWESWERALTRESLRLTQVGSSMMRPIEQRLLQFSQTLEAFNPDTILLKGFALVKADGTPVSEVKALSVGDSIEVQFSDGSVNATVDALKLNKSV